MLLSSNRIVILAFGKAVRVAAIIKVLPDPVGDLITALSATNALLIALELELLDIAFEN